jgi:hypothetical protein
MSFFFLKIQSSICLPSARRGGVNAAFSAQAAHRLFDKVPRAAIRARRRHLHGQAPKPTWPLEVQQMARP